MLKIKNDFPGVGQVSALPTFYIGGEGILNVDE